MDYPFVREYREGDEEKIVELLRIVFPLWKDKTLDHWRWKYHESPLESDIVVAESNSELIGVAHRKNFKIKIGTKTQICQYGDDGGVHPRYRQKGAWREIIDLLNKNRTNRNITTTYSQTTNPIVANDLIKRGRVLFPQKITRLIKVKDVGTHLKYRPHKNNTLVKLGLPLLKIINRLTSHFIPIGKLSHEVKIIDATKFDDTIDEFWDKVRADYLFTLEKNKEFLDWRYDMRGGNYFIKQAKQSGESVGYIAYESRIRDNYEEIFILDLLTLSDRLDIGLLLIKEICNDCEGRSINVMYYQNVVGHPYLAVFRKLGFIDSGSSPFVFIDIAKKDYNMLKNAKPKQVSFTYTNSLH